MNAEDTQEAGAGGLSNEGRSLRGGLAGRSKPGSLIPLWLLAAGAGLVTGTLSGLGAEATYNAFPLQLHFPPGYEKLGGYEKDAVRAYTYGEARKVQERKRAAAAFGLLGLLLGVGLGLTGGVGGGSFRAGLVAAVIGGIAGAGAAWALSELLVPLYFRYLNPEQGMVWLFVTHAGIFAGIGAAGGLALGWGLGDWNAFGRVFVGAVFGALVGAFLLEAVLSVAFPLLRVFEPLPVERVPRLCAHLCVAIATAVLAGISAGEVSVRSAANRGAAALAS